MQNADKIKKSFENFYKKFQLIPLNQKFDADKQKLLTKKLIKLQKKNPHGATNYHSQRADAVHFFVCIKKSQLKTIEYNYHKKLLYNLCT